MRRLASGQHGVGHRQDLRGRSVVLGETHDLGAFVAVGEPGEDLGVGAVPRVDRLVGVADDAQIGPVAEPGVEQALLQGVDVLELVDEQMPEAPALAGGELGVGLEVASAESQQVVEVDHALTALLLLELLEDAGHHRGLDRRSPACLGRSPHIGARLDQSGLGPFDLAHHVERGGAAGELRGQEAGDEPDLAIEQRGRADVSVGPAGAQLGVGDGVERAGGEVVAQAKIAEPMGELAGGFAGEGEGQHVAGIEVVRGGSPGDAPGEHPRLARPRARKDAQRAGGTGDRTSLGVVQSREQPVGVHRTDLTDHL